MWQARRRRLSQTEARSGRRLPAGVRFEGLGVHRTPPRQPPPQFRPRSDPAHFSREGLRPGRRTRRPKGWRSRRRNGAAGRSRLPGPGSRSYRSPPHLWPLPQRKARTLVQGQSRGGVSRETWACDRRGGRPTSLSPSTGDSSPMLTSRTPSTLNPLRPGRFGVERESGSAHPRRTRSGAWVAWGCGDRPEPRTPPGEPGCKGGGRRRCGCLDGHGNYVTVAVDLAKLLSGTGPLHACSCAEDRLVQPFTPRLGGRPTSSPPSRRVVVRRLPLRVVVEHVVFLAGTNEEPVGDRHR